MMLYTFYFNADFYVVAATTYESACRVFATMTSKASLTAATVTSVKAA